MDVICGDDGCFGCCLLLLLLLFLVVNDLREVAVPDGVTKAAV